MLHHPRHQVFDNDSVLLLLPPPKRRRNTRCQCRGLSRMLPRPMMGLCLMIIWFLSSSSSVVLVDAANNDSSGVKHSGSSSSVVLPRRSKKKTNKFFFNPFLSKKKRSKSSKLQETITDTLSTATTNVADTLSSATSNVVGTASAAAITSSSTSNGGNNGKKKHNNKKKKMRSSAASGASRHSIIGSNIHKLIPSQELSLIIIQNLLAGLASAIALIPEVSTFAITVGLNPTVGLGTTIIQSMICGLLGGRPGLVSGASATVSIILKPLKEQHGHLIMSLAVILGGILQILLGSTRCSKYIRVVPKPVMLGFVNGLSIKVIKAQIPHFQQHHHNHNHGSGNIEWLSGDTLKYHSILVIMSAIIIDILPHYTNALPSSLVALVLSTIITKHYDLPVPKLVDIVGNDAFVGGKQTLLTALFPFIKQETTIESTVAVSAAAAEATSSWFPPFHTILNFETLFVILPTAIEMALVGLLQSLLTLQIIDDKTHTKGKNTKESISQGISNFVSGSLGGMGGSALLGQSLVNVNSGGTTRLSSIAVSIFVIGGVTLFAPLLGILPVGALVGLMLSVAKHTFSWSLLQDIVHGKVPLVDIFIIAMTTYTTAYQSMVLAVIFGVLASALRFAWQASCNLTIQETGTGIRGAFGVGGRSSGKLNPRYIRISGQLFFASTTTFLKLCQPTIRDRETAEIYKARQLMKQKKIHDMAMKKKKQQQKRSSSDHNQHEVESDNNTVDTTTTTATIHTGRETVIDFVDSQVWDHAAIMAIESLAQNYHDLGVRLILKHLSQDCREKLLESTNLKQLSNVELIVDASNDPIYLVGADPKYAK